MMSAGKMMCLDDLAHGEPIPPEHCDCDDCRAAAQAAWERRDTAPPRLSYIRIEEEF